MPDLLATTPPTAGLLVVAGGAAVHAEADVEAGHVVGHVGVEVEQHLAAVPHYLGHTRNLGTGRR